MEEDHHTGGQGATPAELARSRPCNRPFGRNGKPPACSASQDGRPRPGARREGRGAAPGPTLAAVTAPWRRAWLPCHAGARSRVLW